MRAVRPWRFVGRSEIWSDPDQLVLDRVVRGLAEQCKAAKWHGDDTISFTERSWVSPNWVTLAMFSSGRVWIDGRWLRYELNCLFPFLFCLIGPGILGTVLICSGNIKMGLTLWAAGFAWLYGGNLAIAFLRVPRLFRKFARGR